MVDYRKILRLQNLGDSQRSIALKVQSSRNTVAAVIIAAKAVGLFWPLGDDVTNEVISEVLFLGKYVFASPYTVPDYEWIHRELARTGVTLTLLWSEYCFKVRNDGGIPYMYTPFCEKYRRWARVTKATMRISHKPGDAMQVDWLCGFSHNHLEPITTVLLNRVEHEPKIKYRCREEYFLLYLYFEI